MDAEQASNSFDTVKPEEKKVDWELIEREYTAGVISTRQIADATGVSEGAIRKRAAKFGWKRNLQEKIKRAARAKIEYAAGAQSVRSTQSGSRVPPVTGVLLVRTEGPTDQEIIDAASDNVARIVTEHMQSARRLRSGIEQLVEQMLVEAGDLQAVRAGLELVIREEVAEGSLSPQAAVFKRQALRQALSMPGLSKAASSLAAALGKAVEIERQAYGLDSDEGRGEKDASYEDRMKRLHEAGLVDTDGTGKLLEPLDGDRTGTEG